MSSMPEREWDYVGRLEHMVRTDDRGALAALRRGLGHDPGAVVGACRYLFPFMPADRTLWEENLYFLLAALFALWHQGGNTIPINPPRNLGASFAQLAAEVQSESTEHRFMAMLKSHRDDLPNHLRHAVGLLKSKGIPVDWRQLLRDLRYWDHEDQIVQRSWARAFWEPSKE